MKFAFSTECCPEWDLATTVAGKARELGYDGVELIGVDQAGAPGHLLLDDPARNLDIVGAFKAAGIEVACIAAPLRLPSERGPKPRDAERMAYWMNLSRWIDLAAELGCTRLMIRDPEPRRGMSGGGTGGELLGDIADHALARGVTILIRNDSTLTSARLMWTFLERLGHPAIACCWDLNNGVRAGESPALSVPTLNSRIQYARAGGIAHPPTANGCATEMSREPTGASDVQLFLTRLRGIGYEGYVTASGQTAGHAGPDVYLGEMAAVLRRWGTRVPSAVAAGRKQETRPKAG